MEEQLDNAKEELKRVDHLIYVSLKYTRTVDVIRNVIDRLLNSFDYILISMRKKAEEEEKIEEIPIAPKLKCEKVEELYPDDEKIHKILELYIFLRRLMKQEYDCENEYRRHVTMIAELEGKEHRLDIDIVTEYYKLSRETIEYIEQEYLK